MPWIPLLLFILAFAAYRNSFNVPFLFDDIPYIVENPSIRKLWPVWETFLDRDGEHILGRPLTNLTYAVNYHFGKTDVRGYHLVNFSVHVLAAATLFGILRRHLMAGPDLAFAPHSTLVLPFACAALWMLHPMQTEAVTYVYQRCESLMGLLFLTTVYCAVRSRQSGKPMAWEAAAVAAFGAGVGVKEVIAVAPLLIFAGHAVHSKMGTMAALRTSRRMYAGFAAGLMLLAVIVFHGDVGDIVSRQALFTPWQYAASQPQVVLHYIRTALWPSTLCLDYGWQPSTLTAALPFAAVIALVVAAGGYGLFKRRTWGLLVLGFFAVLSPSSSFVPLRNIAFEHRMYIPMAALIILLVFGGYTLGRGIIAHFSGRKRSERVFEYGFGALLIALSLVLGMLTFQRNNDYRSPEAIWKDTLKKRPLNHKAHIGYGNVLLRQNRLDEAMAHFKTAVDLQPAYPAGHINIGTVWYRRGETGKAISHFENALALAPQNVTALMNLGAARAQSGRLEEARVLLERVLSLEPRNPGAHFRLAMVYKDAGQPGKTVAHLKDALYVDEENVAVYLELGKNLFTMKKHPEAAAYLERAAGLDPANVPVRLYLADALAASGLTAAAVTVYKDAIRLAPDNANAHNNLGVVFGKTGRLQEAIGHFNRALQLDPGHENARKNLELAMKKVKP